MRMPTIEPYCSYSSNNYGAHCLCVSIGAVTVWFSYKTPVAFQTGLLPRVVRQNEWGPTTGKYLNAIDGGNKKTRVASDVFEKLWAQHVTKAS